MTNIKYLSYVLVIVYGVLNMASSQFADRERFLDRHNLGYVLKKEQNISHHSGGESSFSLSATSSV